MKKAFARPEQLDLVAIAADVRRFWEQNDTFRRSIAQREGAPNFVFYEGPPSANGLPGIHHVLGRTIKDIVCRYKTQRGFRVLRRGGWDTHGLPVELQVEERLGIRKDDVGKGISIEAFNAECRKDVMRFKEEWEALTRKLGYWIDLEDPYVTFAPRYIETLWWILKKLFRRGLLYRGYSIQPYSPGAGTGLSSHELNQPGTYRDVKDVSITVMFQVLGEPDEYFLAWTTTPWTLPSNTALAVNPELTYVKVRTPHPYDATRSDVFVYLAEEALGRYFTEDDGHEVVARLKGKDLVGMKYQPLFTYVDPGPGAYRVVPAEFVEAGEGTGIVHIAPTFGEDDFRVAQEQGVPMALVPDPENPRRKIPLVDRRGRFVPQVTDFAGRYVKNYTDKPDREFEDVNLEIALKLKQEGKVFRMEKYVHAYPHCWRTDKPILYYPLEAWFIRTTAVKDELIALNKTIRWHPPHIGEGRYGNWLENLIDWNLSRSRFWGTPLPVWMTEDESEVKCIGSFAELRREVEKARAAGIEQPPLGEDFDPHRPYVDRIVLVSDSGKPMHRVPDVVDVWFDSGAMPYAQWHYPFENRDVFKEQFPADFIAEGVDQTRGWFHTLHVLATLLFHNVAYKNVLVNGLVLDEKGNKMSKRLGNVVNPFEVLDTYGPDPTRWYMVYHAPPWENLRFSLKQLDEVRRKFFGTLFNVYSFFALYANIDGFTFAEAEIPFADRPEMDRWILSLVNSVVRDVTASLDSYDLTGAVRRIHNFVIDDLSNWYVRLNRRRFWRGSYEADKISAYQTLYLVMETLAGMMAPFAPFFADWLYRNLNGVTGRQPYDSVHLGDFPVVREAWHAPDLEEKMALAQEVVSLVLSLRKKARLRVRQPLRRIIAAPARPELMAVLESVAPLILQEVNVKALEVVPPDSDFLVKEVKPNFSRLGPRLGRKMKSLHRALQALGPEEVATLERTGKLTVTVDGAPIELTAEDLEIKPRDIPGFLVAYSPRVVVALDTQIDAALRLEGMARDLINRIQRLRKSRGLEVTTRINLYLSPGPEIEKVVEAYGDMIRQEVLAKSILFATDDHLVETFSIEGVPVGVGLEPVEA